MCFKRIHSRKATYTCLNPIVHKVDPCGGSNPGRRFSRRNQGNAQSTGKRSGVKFILLHVGNYLHQTPPEKAIKTLNAFVLLSVLCSECIPRSMPTITAKMINSPAEQIANETFEIRLREREWKRRCSSELCV